MFTVCDYAANGWYCILEKGHQGGHQSAFSRPKPKRRYELWGTVDLVVTSKAVAEALAELNVTFKELNLPPMSYTAKLSIGSFTIDKELTKEELAKIETELGDIILKSRLHTEYGLRLAMILPE